jgi:LPXTG-motif cell wall-anchored protein
VAARSQKPVIKPTHTNVADTVEASGKYSIYVITSDLQLTKYGRNYAADSELQKLDGATFGLYRRGTNGQDELVGTLQTTANGGIIAFENLSVGEYYIAETEAPTGYGRTNKQFNVKVEAIDGKYKVTVDSDKLDAAGNANAVEALEYVITPSLTENNGVTTVTKAVVNNNRTLADGEKINTNVINYIAYRLPETGGSGVYVYTIGGVLLMIGAALLLYKNKKNKNK